MAQQIIDINRAAGQTQASFVPATLNVSNGDQISWRNNDERPPNTPLNPPTDPESHWPAPLGGKATDWFSNPIPGKPEGFDPPMSQGVVTFSIKGPADKTDPPTSQTFKYFDATGNTNAVGTIVVWNPAPPATADPVLAD